MDRRSLLADIDGVEEKIQAVPEELHQRSGGWYRPMIVAILALSTLVNLALGASLFAVWTKTHSSWLDNSKSQYAGLTRSYQEPYVKKTLYTSDNETLQAEMWHNINIDAGMVALSDDWVSAHDLRRAQRFPWDHTKGVYLLHGFHNLHCVKIVYNALHEYKTSKPQSRNWHHVVHCLDALRQQTLCDADDTPRATERRAEVVTGVGQYRKCRSWGALEQFARTHTACYRRPENPEDGTPIVERFKHCPEGVQYTFHDNYVPVDEVVAGLPKESRLDESKR